MSESERLAISYLRPQPGSLWRWEDEGQALVWADGKTIAFRAEVEEVLSRLAPGGLPPFAPIVLVLAACRENWRAAPTASVLVHGVDRWFQAQTGPRSRRIHDWLVKTFESLDRITDLPPARRRHARAKALIAEVVFEHHRSRGTPEAARAILEAFRRGIPHEALCTPRAEVNLLTALRLADLEGLWGGLARLDSESLSMRERTGLDRLPGQAPIELPAGEQARRLIERLLKDPELEGFARLARDLTAAIHIPKPVVQVEELPVGGVSDISTRGPLDRLLVSELAHDDDTLSIRVALNEALYLRREVPHTTPPRTRGILIDSGVRSWGVPRVFSTAVALAVAATSGGEVFAYRATDEAIEPVDLITREGLIEHLAALETAPHPGRALPAFLRALHASDGEVDPILVVQEDVLADPDFLVARAQVECPLLHVATVERGGGFRLLQLTSRGKKMLGSAILKLEHLLAPPQTSRKTESLLSGPPATDLPAILKTSPFPLLLSCPVPVQRARFSPDRGVVGVARDGRVLLWEREGRGARELTPYGPRDTILRMDFDSDDSVQIVILRRPENVESLGDLKVLFQGHLSDGRDPETLMLSIVHVGLDTGNALTVDLAPREGPLHAVWRRAGTLYVHTGESVEAISTSPGTPGETLSTRGYFLRPPGWAPYFQRHGDTHTYTFHWEANDLVMAPVPERSLAPDEHYTLLLEPEGLEGTWVLTSRGRCINLQQNLTPSREQTLQLYSSPLRYLGISQDQTRILVETETSDLPRKEILHLGYKPQKSPARGTQAELEPDIWRITRRGPQLRRHVRGIFLHRGERLCLSVRKQKVIGICSGPSGLSLLHLVDAAPRGEGLRTFHPVELPARQGVRLRVASWQDGSQAFLDSRGLLHLRSSDPAVPELSLVLSDKAEIAVWASTGEVCGPEYFTGDLPRVDPTIITEYLSAFTRRLR